MTIDEAINRLTIALPTKRSGLNADYHNSVRLGIEALKRIKASRLDQWNIFNVVLPGETKD